MKASSSQPLCLLFSYSSPPSTVQIILPGFVSPLRLASESSALSHSSTSRGSKPINSTPSFENFSARTCKSMNRLRLNSCATITKLLRPSSKPTSPSSPTSLQKLFCNVTLKGDETEQNVLEGIRGPCFHHRSLFQTMLLILQPEEPPSPSREPIRTVSTIHTLSPMQCEHETKYPSPSLLSLSPTNNLLPLLSTMHQPALHPSPTKYQQSFFAPDQAVPSTPSHRLQHA